MPAKIRPAPVAPRAFARRLVAAFGLAALAAGCDQAELQDAFEVAARRPPNGYTQTDAGGQVVANDPDDWRTSPAYAGRASVRPVYPNPSGDGLPFTLDVSILAFDGPPGGVVVRGYDGAGRPFVLADLRENQPGTYALPFSPLRFPSRGLHRVLVQDGLGGLISYGDVVVP